MVLQNSATPLPDQTARGHRSAGFSVIELLIVFVVIGIIAGMAILQYSSTKEALNADDAAYRVLNYFREAGQRAASDHHSYRVVINTTTNRISMINENTFATGNGEGDTVAGDDVMVKQEPAGTNVLFAQPTGIALPPAPSNYAAATFTNGQWTAHFMSDGSVVDPYPTAIPLSCTIFLQPSDKTSQLGLLRAVTLFSSSGATRYWMYNTTTSAFVQR
jgi:type II secretory pathway pseudopilin PulG